MFISIDPTDRVPIYQQIADELKALIARGDLHQDVTLPTVRQLAADLGVNLNTIATAYRTLQEEGLISIRHGSGAVVISRRTDEAPGGDFRKSLRAPLTQMVLAGLSRSQIIRVVMAELRELKAR